MNDETLIYRFETILPDGTKKIVALDPFRVDRLMAGALGGEPLHEVIQASKSPVAQLAEEAMEKLLKAVQRAFGVSPVNPDGTGLNEPAQIRILKEFLRWKTEVKKNIGSLSTSSSPTGQPCSPCQQKNGTPSGASVAVPNSNAPPWLVPASPPPSA